MEGIRKAALAYYDKSSVEIQDQIRDFFLSMDTDGDGSISITEFLKYVENNIGGDKPVMLSDLDRDENYVLDFNEVKVYFYMVYFRSSFCAACGNQIKEVYFTCCECFLSTHCYNICLTCYGSRGYRHEHNNFIDNYGMLMRTREELMKLQESGNYHTYMGPGQANNSMAAPVATANQIYMGHGRDNPMAATVAMANQTYMGPGRANPMAATVATPNQWYMGPGRANQFATAVATGITTNLVANQIGTMLNPHPQPVIVPSTMTGTSPQIGTVPATDPGAATSWSISDWNSSASDIFF